MKAIIKGKAKATIEYYDDKDDVQTKESNILSPYYLKQLDGIEIPDNFVDYADHLSFYNKLVEGYTHFKFEDDSLWSVCEYELKEPLTEEELKELAEDTQGQWSDGIGEGFEQFACTEIDKNEVFISPWIPEQELIYYQTN